jgi:hypothetical protein
LEFDPERLQSKGWREREKRIENGHQIKLEKESEKAIVNFLFIADI